MIRNKEVSISVKKRKTKSRLQAAKIAMSKKNEKKERRKETKTRKVIIVPSNYLVMYSQTGVQFPTNKLDY